jgi:hypothetical protein
MLVPGFAHAFHAHVLGRSPAAVRSYRLAALEAAHRDPALRDEASAIASSLRPPDGLAMARLRGSCQLPIWTCLAICEFRKQGYSVAELASAFQCSVRTIASVVSRSVFLSAERKLSPQQLCPPGMFRRAGASNFWSPGTSTFVYS